MKALLFNDKSLECNEPARFCNKPDKTLIRFCLS